MPFAFSKHGYPLLLPEEDEQLISIVKPARKKAKVSPRVTFAKDCQIKYQDNVPIVVPLEAANLKQDNYLLLDEHGQQVLLEPDVDFFEERLLSEARRRFAQKCEDPIIKTPPREEACKWEDIIVLLEDETIGSPNVVDAYLKNSTRQVKIKNFEEAMERLESVGGRIKKSHDRKQVRALRDYRSLLIDTAAEKGFTEERMVYATASIHRVLFKIQHPDHPNNQETGVNSIRGPQTARKVIPCDTTKWFTGLMCMIFGAAAVVTGLAFIAPTHGLTSLAVGAGLFGMFKGRSMMRDAVGSKEIPYATDKIFSSRVY